MEIINKILRELKNALEYYEKTEDETDLVSDIQKVITDLTIGCFE